MSRVTSQRPAELRQSSRRILLLEQEAGLPGRTLAYFSQGSPPRRSSARLCANSPSTGFPWAVWRRILKLASGPYSWMGDPTRRAD